MLVCWAVMKHVWRTEPAAAKHDTHLRSRTKAIKIECLCIRLFVVAASKTCMKTALALQYCCSSCATCSAAAQSIQPLTQHHGVLRNGPIFAACAVQLLSTMARRRSDAAAAAEPVRVVIRVRPMNKAERSIDSTAAVQVVSDRAVQLDLENENSYSFACNGGFGEDTSQAAFFASSGIISLLDDTLAGYHATAFAHGQTSAGKTYTQLGSERASGTAQWDAEHGLGLLPRSLNYLFTQMQSLSAEGWLFSVRISCLEIYQENVYDLTVKGAYDRKSLVIREHPTLGFFVEGLSCTNVRSETTASTLVSAALANRHVGSHSMNSRSNRSHTLVTIHVDAQAADSAVIRSGRITFIDLAGSERLRADATIGKAHRESCYINKSLYTLGKVVQRIGSNTNNSSRSSIHRGGSVPYRDSKLTMLLISSLGGKGRTLMIANISPAKTMANETYRTLCFALGVNRIRNQPVVTVVNPEQQIISELRHEVNRLRLENSELRQSLLSGPVSNSSTCDDHHMTLEHLFDVNSSATDGNSITTTTAAAGAMRSHSGSSKQQRNDSNDVDASTTCSAIDTNATKGGIWSRTGINGRVSHTANVAATHNNSKQKQQQQQHRDIQQRDVRSQRQGKHTATDIRHHGAVVRPHTTCTTDSTTKRRHDAITASIAQTKSRLQQVTAQLIDAHANGDVTTEYKLAQEIKALQLEQKLQQQLHGLVQGTSDTPVATAAHSSSSSRSAKHGTAVTTATLTHDKSANTSSNNSDSGNNNMLSAWREQWQLAHSILTTPTNSSSYRPSAHKPNSSSSNGAGSVVNGIHSLPGSSSSQRRNKRSSPHSSDKSAFSKSREKHFIRAYPAATNSSTTTTNSTSADVYKRIGWGSSIDVQQQQKQQQQQYRKQYSSSRDSNSVKEAHKQYVSSIMQQQRAAKGNGFIF
jgi:kinesin family member 12